jgi:acetyltransferase-like isoleucine patch superfamily enzyme
MDIHPRTKISLKARLDRTNPKGVHIGEGSVIVFGAVILTHDLSRVLHTDTYVGRNCFIGANAILLPGVKVGDGSVVAAGSVVTRDIDPYTLVAGNPARVLKTGIRTREWGIFEDSFEEAVAIQIEPVQEPNE